MIFTWRGPSDNQANSVCVCACVRACGCACVRACEDSDIFMQLVYWTWRYDLQVRVAVQMEKWDGVVLDINATWSPCIKRL